MILFIHEKYDFSIREIRFTDEKYLVNKLMHIYMLIYIMMQITNN